MGGGCVLKSEPTVSAWLNCTKNKLWKRWKKNKTVTHTDSVYTKWERQTPLWPITPCLFMQLMKRRRTGCKECAGCLRNDCGKCIFCLDMKKFGGPGSKRQRCRYRVCLILVSLKTCTAHTSYSSFCTPSLWPFINILMAVQRIPDVLHPYNRGGLDGDNHTNLHRPCVFS